MRDGYDWLVQQGRDREAVAVDDVLKFRLEAASAAYWVNLDLENIEELFSLAFAKKDGIATSMRLAIAATLDYARKSKGVLRCGMNVTGSPNLFKLSGRQWPRWVTCKSESTAMMSGHFEGSYEVGKYALHVARLLGMLKNGEPQGENTFITFNYDTLVEEALNELYLPVSYGSRIPFANKATAGDEPISVFKLHGSVNWTRTGQPDNALKVVTSYDELVKSEFMPELVPPTWKKVFEDEIESVWGDAIEKLNTATRIVIIGFSMPPTDMHLKYLLAAGLKQNISLRQIVFVNPDATNGLKARVEEMLRKSYVESGRIDFLKEQLGAFTGPHQLTAIGLHTLGRPAEYALQYELFDQT